MIKTVGKQNEKASDKLIEDAILIGNKAIAAEKDRIHKFIIEKYCLAIENYENAIKILKSELTRVSSDKKITIEYKVSNSY